MTRDNTRLLVVAGSVSSQLEDLGRQILKNGSKIHGRTGSDTLGVVSLPQKTVDTTNGERKTSFGRAAIKMVRLI